MHTTNAIDDITGVKTKSLIMLAVFAFVNVTMAASSCTFNLTGLNMYENWSAYWMTAVYSDGTPYWTVSASWNDSRFPKSQLESMFIPSSTEGTWTAYYSNLKSQMESSALPSVDASGKSFHFVSDGRRYAYLMIALFEDGITPGSEFAVLSSYSAEGDTTHSIDFSSTERTHTILTGTLNSDNGSVPEPTSAILLLVGVASLALRRKQFCKDATSHEELRSRHIKS